MITIAPIQSRLRILISICLAGVVALAAAQVAPSNSPPPAPRSLSYPPNRAATNDPLFDLLLQQPTLDTEAPLSIAVEFDPPEAPLGTRSTYRLVITALRGTIQMPEPLPTPAGLDLQPGGQAESYVVVGGKMQIRSTYLFHARAATAGSFTIPTYTVHVYGKPFQVPEARVAFVEPTGLARTARGQLQVQLPPGDVYVGQALPIKIRWAPVDQNTLHGLIVPQLNSDAFIPVASSTRYSREMVSLDGKSMLAFVNEWVVNPIKQGDHTVLAQAQLVFLPATNNPPLQIPAYNPLVDSDPFVIPVKSLPSEGLLPGFTGAIGEFHLETPRLSTNHVHVGEPVTLSVTVQGQGNFTRFAAPRPISAPGWQAFPAVMDPPIILQPILSGRRSFSYTLIPVSDRAQATPAIPFCYFEPHTRAYVDLTIPSVRLRITASSPAGALDHQPGLVPREPASAPNSDGSYVAPALAGLADHPGGSASLIPLQQRGLFLLFQCLPGAVLAGLWSRAKYRRYLAQHPEVVRRRQARREASRLLRFQRRAWKNRDVEGFVGSAVKALQVMAAPRAQAQPEAMAGHDVLLGWPAETPTDAETRLVGRLFEAADAHRFGVNRQPETNLLDLYPEVEILLKKLYRRL